MNLIPTMLKEEKFKELSKKEPRLKQYYTSQGNGFWKTSVSDREKALVRELFINLGFTAMNFTDSRSIFQFYNLEHLWDDLTIAINNNLTLLHLATEPVKICDLYYHLTGKTFVNELNAEPSMYNFRTCFSSLFGVGGDYIYYSNTILNEIKEFVE